MIWLAIYLPELPLDLLRRGGAASSDAWAVTQSARGGSRVHCCNAAARRHGVEPGLTVAAARARCEILRAVARDRGREQAALRRVAAWALQYSSEVVLDGPAGLLLEVQGSLRLFGGLDRLWQRIARGLSDLDYRALLASAPTPEAASRLARSGAAGRCEDAADLRSKLSALPLAALPLEPSQRAALAAAGMRVLGDLLVVPRAQLGRRTGQPFLHWLQQLLGEVADPRPRFQPPARFEGWLELPQEVVHTEALLFPARRLLQELEGYLIGRQLGARRLHWRLGHADLPPTRLSSGMRQPQWESSRLLQLFAERLQGQALPAPVRALALDVDSLQPLSAQPRDLFEVRESGAGECFLDTLRARLGTAAVTGIRPLPDHRPERAWEQCEPGTPGPQLRFPERPLWLLAEPRPLAERQGRPWLDGPLRLESERERIETGWWDDAQIARDYFVAHAADGQRLWIFRERASRRWFLHGVF